MVYISWFYHIDVAAVWVHVNTHAQSPSVS
jgi:hypothetical protein